MERRCYSLTRVYASKRAFFPRHRSFRRPHDPSSGGRKFFEHAVRRVCYASRRSGIRRPPRSLFYPTVPFLRILMLECRIRHAMGRSRISIRLHGAIVRLAPERFRMRGGVGNRARERCCSLRHFFLVLGVKVHGRRDELLCTETVPSPNVPCVNFSMKQHAYSISTCVAS